MTSRRTPLLLSSEAATQILEAAGAHHPSGLALELGGGGELGGFQFADAGLEAVNATLKDGQLGFEFLEQATQLVGHFGDPVEASVQQGSRFVAGVARLPRKVPLG